MPRIEPALDTHLTEILEIYNEVIANSTAVYSETSSTLGERAAWLADRRAGGFPVLIALDEAEGSVTGFASYGEWRGAWSGYRHTIEHSVHVRRDRRGQGIGGALITALCDEARRQDKHVMIGGIDADNEPSLRLHEKLGFTRAAHFREVGQKFGRWLDLVFVQRILEPRYRIFEDDLSGEETRALLALHLAGMQAASPPGTVFALDLSGLKKPGVTIWTARQGERCAGIGALKLLGGGNAEVKSMRTHPDHLRQGVGEMLLLHIIAQARATGLSRLSLETGMGPDFAAAHTLYLKHGFVIGEKFADYEDNGFSTFFHREL